MLPQIKSLLSGKNPIKITPKGTRYKFFQVKKRFSNQFVGRGHVCFFYDFGSKACFTTLKYGFNGIKNVSTKNDQYWFKIVGDRMVISAKIRDNYRIISNAPQKISSCYKTSLKGETKYISPNERLKKFLLKWAAKNGVKIKKKWHKYDIIKVCYLLCYPEIEYFLDFTKDAAIMGISSSITSNLRGIKGLNHGLDRLCGFHGKKLKRLIQENTFVKLKFCRILKGIITPDDLILLLENNKSGNDYIFYDHNIPVKHIRDFLKHYHRDTIVKWLNVKNNHSLIDSVNMYYLHKRNYPMNKIQLPNSNDLTEVHNSIALQNRNAQSLKLYEGVDFIKKNEKYRFFETEIDNLKIELPKIPQDLVEASTILSNCLSAYVHFHEKDGLILLVSKDNVLTYAISLRGYNNNFTLEQFYGKYNQTPAPEDKKKIELFLSQYVNTVNN